MKVIPDGARIAPRLGEFAAACGEGLARAHAEVATRPRSAYIGRGRQLRRGDGRVRALLRRSETNAITGTYRCHRRGTSAAQ